MATEGLTFGQAIGKARKGLGLSQKELASQVKKEEDGSSISPQYRKRCGRPVVSA